MNSLWGCLTGTRHLELAIFEVRLCLLSYWCPLDPFFVGLSSPILGRLSPPLGSVGPPLWFGLAAPEICIIHLIMVLYVHICHGLASAGNKEPHSLSLIPPLTVGWGGESEGKGENLWVGIKTV